ncbi:MAG: lytic transglycosylase domain-containing protein [Pseudomonadales bacterium]|uniref:Lytic murein transglycosylase n=1 Tax=Oleiphilus messinensis TaxID=141451 RepID=A0A1Y0I8R7_9GAMM|nr:lytic murein transglycosylase [Oleiphilus messinensis]MCG8612028.1 lytic transglycosylase domain-containing protein [Pseudomonadales bacterium]
MSLSPLLCFAFLISLFSSINSLAGQQLFDAELRDLLKNTITDNQSFADRYDAEVWLVDMSTRLEKFVKSPKQRLEWLELIHREANRAGVEPELVLAVIEIESHFNRFAISRVGAQGLMQVMPFWKKEIGRSEDNLTQVQTNLRYGCTILKHYIDKEKGNLTRALARYNGSLGKTWYPEKVMNAWEKNWFVNY